jgi:thioredoxin reductase
MKNMNKLRRFLLLLAFILPGLLAHAQEGLNIEKIFNDYGKQEGSVLIELAKDVLGNHTKISRYRSLIIPSDSVILNTTREAILNDFVKTGHYGNEVVLMESKKDGKVESATYALGNNGNSSAYEYILFTNKSKKMTLIYLKGNFPPKQLESELNKLKDLFIKVNNKRIKL